MPPAASAAAASATAAAAAAAAEPESEMQAERAVHPSTKFEAPATWTGWLLGSGYLALLVACAFVNVALLGYPLLLAQRALGLRDATCRPALRLLEGWYFAMLAGLLELAGGVRVAMAADAGDARAPAFPPRARVLLICNHRSEVDWFFFWSVGLRLGCHDRIRVMMKAVIRHAPGVGWAMMILNFPFVKRSWATDEARISRLVAAYREYTSGVWLAMFPEGTALYDKTLEQSHAFARGRGEPQWQYVLHPRVRGFELCVKELDPDYVVDLTVAYPELMQGVRPSPIRFARGQFPSQVDVLVQRYSRSELAKHAGAMDRWLKDRFQEKEALLQSYYEHGAFVGKKRVCERAPIGAAVCAGVAFNALLLAAAGRLLAHWPWPTLAWMALCSALSIRQARSFGSEDKEL